MMAEADVVDKVEDQVEIESKAEPEVQAEAEKMGWIPPTRFKGEADKFVDADEYLERGKQVIPIINQRNQQLVREIAGLKQQNSVILGTLETTKKAMEDAAIQASADRARAVEKAKAEVKAQLVKAHQAEDHESIVELQDELNKLNVAPVVEPVKKEPETPRIQAPEIDPVLVEWIKDNPWFNQDKRKSALAVGIAQELKEGGETLTGRAFYDKVGAEVDAMVGARRPAASKVEGTRNGNEGGSRSKQSYASLPADAKAACSEDTAQFVGAGKKFKTEAEWQAEFAKVYYSQE